MNRPIQNALYRAEDEGMEIPNIKTIESHRVPEARGVRWCTHIVFENGVVLRFSGKLAGDDARYAALTYYGQLIDGGWTDDEILDAFVPKNQEPAQ